MFPILLPTAHAAGSRYKNTDRMVVTRMDTLKSGWTHYVYYTTHMFFFCFLSYLMTPVMCFE